MLGDIVVVVKHESKRVLPKTSGIGVVFFSERSPFCKLALNSLPVERVCNDLFYRLHIQVCNGTEDGDDAARPVARHGRELPKHVEIKGYIAKPGAATFSPQFLLPCCIIIRGKDVAGTIIL